MVDFSALISNHIKDNQTLKTLALITFVAVSSITGTYMVLDKTIMEALRGRLENLSYERKNLIDDNKELKSRAEQSQLNAAGELKEKTDNLSKFYEAEVGQVTKNYVLALKENENLKTEIARLENERLSNSKAAADKYLSVLQTKSAQTRNEINELYHQLESKSTQYGFAKTQCEGDEKEIFVNVCEHASQYESEMKTLRERIGSLEKYSENIHDQIISQTEK